MLFEVKLGSLCFLFAWMIKVDTLVDALACYLTLNSGINILFTYSHNLFLCPLYLYVVQSFAFGNDSIFTCDKLSFFFPISITFLY